MKNKAKRLASTVLMTSALVVGAVSASAATFGSTSSGASSKESWQIKYNGAAWNYDKSKYRSTSFKYTRNGITLTNKVAFNGKVTDSVLDDLRWGDKYTTKFSWARGSLK